MRRFDHVLPDADRLGDHWLNTDTTRFALTPQLGKAQNERVAEEVERLVTQYGESKSSKEKSAIIGDLIALHARGKILWPMGAFFNHSVLGAVDVLRLHKDLRERRSELLILLDALEADKTGPFSDYKNANRRTFNYAAWKSLLALRLTTTKPLTTLPTYEHDDFEALAGLVRPAGEWAEWFAQVNKKAVQYAARHLAQRRNDPHFGASLSRLVNPALPGPRHRDPFKIYPHLKWLDTHFEAWLDESKILMKKGPRSGKRLLGDFFITIPEERCSKIETAFNPKDMVAFMTFARTWSTPLLRVQAMGRIKDFLDYIQRQDEAGAIGAPHTVQLAIENHEIEHFTRSVHVPVKTSRGEVQARPMPTRYHLRLKEIITEDDFAWPKSLRNAVNGQPLHWVPWRDPETGRSAEVFCPVMARMLLLQLDLPLRNVQARRLDSGEGDTERWNHETGAWNRNTGSHGGRWERLGAGNPRRGCIRRIPTGEGGSITGIWVNSNKTQDRGVLFDDTAGYEIPWQHADVLKNLAAMRDWQERYNTVDGPLPHAALASNIFEDEPSAAVRALLPDHFYLFRYPQNPGMRGREMPPTYSAFLQFFYDALEELERRLREEDPENPVTIITGRDHSNAPKKAVFTLHGMRSSTLTGLHLAGVPIEVLSKLVAGHASILMTLSYIKLDPLHVSQVLTEARLKAANDAKAAFPNLLRNATFENAVRMTARLADDGLAQMKGAYTESSVWLRLDIGLCPNGGTLCRTGGEVIQRRNDKGTDKSVYAPVPGGARNCVRCRFFVTGLPFLIPLWAHGSAIMARSDALARQAAERDDELRRLKQHRKHLREQRQDVPRDLDERIKVTDELHVSDCERRDQALADFHATLTLIEKVRSISRRGGEPGPGSDLPMLLPEEEIPEIFGRESTRFEVIDAVVQQSRCFPSLESADIERERDEFLNQILYRNGYVPIGMSPLSLAERRGAADAMATFLLMELGASETDHLATGRKSLTDFALQDRLEDACHRAIGRPLDRIGLRPALEMRPVYLDVQAAE